MMKSSFIKVMLVAATFTLPFSVSAEMVNINSASAATISYHLKGIGDKKASSIVSYREVNGDFIDIKDIINVKGIGKGLLKKNFKDMSLTEGVVKLGEGQVKVKPLVIESKKVSKSKVIPKSGKKVASAVVKSAGLVKVKKKKGLKDQFSSSAANEKKGEMNKLK